MAGKWGLLDFDWDRTLPDEERDRVLGKIVDVVRKWRMEVPAVLFLESGVPLSHIAGQGLVAFCPFVAPLLPGGIADVQKLHKLLERPANVRLLIDRIADDAEDRTPSDAARG